MHNWEALRLKNKLIGIFEMVPRLLMATFVVSGLLIMVICIKDSTHTIRATNNKLSCQTGGYFSKNVSLTVQIWWKCSFTIIQPMVVFSTKFCSCHRGTIVLLCHMEINCITIPWPQVTLSVALDLNYRHKMLVKWATRLVPSLPVINLIPDIPNNIRCYAKGFLSFPSVVG